MNEILFFIIGYLLLVPAIHMFDFHKQLLVGGILSRYFFLFCVLLSIIGISYTLGAEVGKDKGLLIAISLSPLAHVALFKLLYTWFTSRYQREPISAYYELTKINNLFPIKQSIRDLLFHILWISGFAGVPIFLNMILTFILGSR
jgi:hypothetical protein